MLVIPTYQERGNIAPLVARVRQAAARLPILFVDDSSPDGTADEIRRIQETDAGVRLLQRPGKGGFGSACLDGMKLALREDLAEFVILADSDLSHPPEVLPRMIALLQEYDVVIGSRYIKNGGVKDWEFIRRNLSYGANLYARVLTGVPVCDLTAGFVGYRTSALRAIDLEAFVCEGYAFQIEMKVTLHRQGILFCEFPIIFAGRNSGKSKFSFKTLVEGVSYPLSVVAHRLNRG